MCVIDIFLLMLTIGFTCNRKYVHVINGCFYPIGGSKAPVTLRWMARTVEEAAFVAAMKGRRATYFLSQT